MKEYICRIKQSHVMEVRGEAKDAEEFLLYVNELVAHQPKVEILLPQDADGQQISNDPNNPPYVVMIEYLSTAHKSPTFEGVVDGSFEEVTLNVEMEVPIEKQAQ